MRSLGMHLGGIFSSRHPVELDSWIDDAKNSGLDAIEPFARVLHRDLERLQRHRTIVQQRPAGKRAMYGLARRCSGLACSRSAKFATTQPSSNPSP